MTGWKKATNSKPGPRFRGVDSMRAITVKGYKKTGKTTTCIRIIEELRRRGYTVGSVKNTHFPGFAIDPPDTDSFRHAKAGACKSWPCACVDIC